MARNISFTIKYWKQNGPQDKGHFDTHEMKNIPDDTSFLEMLDILNEELIDAGRTKAGLEEGLRLIANLRKEFNTNLFIPGKKEGLNVELDKAIHLRDFILMGELIAYDALHREESCGGHFREEYQTEEGEAKRDDEHFFYVGCWEYKGETETPELIKENLKYEAIKVQTRNYKN